MAEIDAVRDDKMYTIDSNEGESGIEIGEGKQIQMETVANKVDGERPLEKVNFYCGWEQIRDFQAEEQ